MNNYKIDLSIASHIRDKNEVNDFDGSFESDKYFKKGSKTLTLLPEYFSQLFPELSVIYPYKNMSVKIFLDPTKLDEITKIQRIYSWYGLAPKVFRCITIEDSKGISYRAQLIEFIDDEFCYDRIEANNVIWLMNKIKEIEHIDHCLDVYPSNIIGGRWIDFGNFALKEKEKYKSDIAVRYNNQATWGNSKSAYQKCDDLGVVGGRGNIREDIFELDKFDFENKTVLDIGCSGGHFTNYCAKRGARAIGVDMLSVVESAREVANWLSIDSEFYYIHLGLDDAIERIKRLTGIKEFDYVFFLSMDQHIGFQEYLGDVAKTLFFESNGGMLPDEEHKIFSEKLNKLFPTVEYKGNSKEGAERNLWVCQK